MSNFAGYSPSDFDAIAEPEDERTITHALPDAEAVDVAELKIPSRIKDLILSGWLADNGYRSRSEADMAVCAALARAGVNEAGIRGIFEAFPIGAKFREKGRDGPRYLALTIDKAQSKLDATAPPQNNTPPPAEEDRPRALDVASIADEEETEQDAIVCDLILPGLVVGVAGEEGDGKTTLVDQLLREIVRGETVLGCFESGEVVVSKVLLVDTEMEPAEIARRCREMEARGLAVPEGSMFWLCAGGLNLDASEEDRRYVRDEIARTGAELVWVDSGGNAIGDPKDDVPVKALFNWLSEVMREGVLASGLTLHPRKRSQGEYGRRFDDLFGSREWKGRLGKALYIEEGTVVAWKDRGWHLRRRWAPAPGTRYPRASLERPGASDPTARPFEIEYQPDLPAADAAELREKAIGLVRDVPGSLTKSSLAARLGGRRGDALGVVEQLLASGTLGPDKARAKLHVLNHEQPTIPDTGGEA